VKITVTQEDIDRGQRKSMTKCPVARAVQAATGAEHVSVARSTIVVDFWSGVRPDVVAEFIKRYDYGFDVQPFEFDMDFEPQEAK
jgi:hypothetical protein